MRWAPARIAHSYSRRSVAGSERVVSSVTYITCEAFLHRELDRVLGGLAAATRAPPFGVLADRRRADEHADFDRQAGALDDLDDRRDVGDRACARRSWRAPSAWRRRSRAPGARRRATTCGPAPGRPMSAVSMPSLSIRWRISIFCVDRRRPHRRRLQSVAQRLVVEHHARRLGRRADLVPVVDQGFEHLRLDFGAAPRDGRRPRRPRRRAIAASHDAGMPRGGADHGPEAVVDGERRQPLLVPDDLRSDERVAGGARVCQSNVTLKTTMARSKPQGHRAMRVNAASLSFRSGVFHDQRRHVVVLLGAVGEFLDGVDDLLEHDVGAAARDSAPSPATRRASPNSSPATLCASVTPSL